MDADLKFMVLAAFGADASAACFVYRHGTQVILVTSLAGIQRDHTICGMLALRNGVLEALPVDDDPATKQAMFQARLDYGERLLEHGFKFETREENQNA